MKTEHLILLAVGGYFLYRYYKNLKAGEAASAAFADYIQSGGGGSGGGGGTYVPQSAQVVYQQIAVPVRQKLNVNPMSSQFVAQHSATLPANTGNVAGFDGYCGTDFGIKGICDTSNKLTRYNTNANFNAVTLKY